MDHTKFINWKDHSDKALRVAGQFFCFIHFLLYVFRLLCLRFFNCRKDQSFRIFF